MKGYGDWLISADDHVIEPSHVWQTHVASRYRDRAPKVVHGDGDWQWDYDGKRTVISGLAAVAGTSSDEWDPRPMNLEAPRIAAYSDPRARIELMNEDHVIASMLFPTYPRFCGQTFMEGDDKDLGLACIRAYNDWMIDEWCAAAPGRFIPLALVPMWDAELAAHEVGRVAPKGARAIAFSENPSRLGLPSIHDRDRAWDPLFRACVDHGLPLAIHAGSSSHVRLPSPDAPLIERSTFLDLAALETVVEWVWSGNLDRYPELRIVLAESGISWVPAVLERMRRNLHRWRWARSTKHEFDGDVLTGDAGYRGRPLEDLPVGFDPVAVFHQSIFMCMVADDYGWDSLEYLGTGNVMVETDYPHPDSSFPHSAKLLAERLGPLPEVGRHEILRDNACRVFDFTPVPAASLPIGANGGPGGV